MIDFERLKEAHELCQNTEYVITAELGYQDRGHYQLIDTSTNKCIIEGWRIDSITDKIRWELKRKTKYKAGDKVWYVNGRSILSSTVALTYFPIEGWGQYKLDDPATDLKTYSENELFSSREELINDQVNYWLIENTSFAYKLTDFEKDCCEPQECCE